MWIKVAFGIKRNFSIEYHPAKANAVDCTNLVAVAYVQKPFSADKIRTVLKEMDNNPLCTEREKPNTEDLFSSAKLSLDKHDYDKALEHAL